MDEPTLVLDDFHGQSRVIPLSEVDDDDLAWYVKLGIQVAIDELAKRKHRGGAKWHPTSMIGE